jgi:hypothetical protein
VARRSMSRRAAGVVMHQGDGLVGEQLAAVAGESQAVRG